MTVDPAGRELAAEATMHDRATTRMASNFEMAFIRLSDQISRKRARRQSGKRKSGDLALKIPEQGGIALKALSRTRTRNRESPTGRQAAGDATGDREPP